MCSGFNFIRICLLHMYYKNTLILLTISVFVSLERILLIGETRVVEIEMRFELISTEVPFSSVILCHKICK